MSFQGVVLLPEPGSQSAYVRDLTVGIRVQGVTQNLDIGDVVQIEGVTTAGFAPEVLATKVTRLGRGAVPLSEPVALHQLNSGTNDAQWIRWAGIAVGFTNAPGGYRLDLGEGPDPIPVWVTAKPGDPPLTNQLGRRLIVEAVVQSLTNAANEFVGVRLLVPGTAWLRPTAQRPAPPAGVTNTVADIERQFAQAASLNASDLARFRPGGRPVRLAGTVLFQSRPTRLYCTDDTGPFRVETIQTVNFQPGDWIEIVGNCELVERALWINGVTVRQLGTKPLPPAPAVTLQEIFDRKLDVHRVTVRGRVIGHERLPMVSAVREGVQLDDGTGRGLSVRFPDGTGARDRFPLGSVISASGVTVMTTLPGGLQTVAVYPAKVDDAEIVISPPFWNLRRIAQAAAVAAVLGLATGVWHLIQRRRLLILQASETRLRTLLENSFDATFVLNADGSIKYMTPAARRLLGEDRAKNTLNQAGFAEIVHPDDLPKITAAHQEVLKEPGSSRRVNKYRLILGDGETRWAEAVGTNCLHVPGVEGVVVNVHDITEQITAFGSLERSAELDRQLNEFSSALSPLHDEEDILWEITRQCVKLLKFVDCLIYVLDEERGVLVQRAAFGPKNPRGREIHNPIAIPLGEGIVGSVAKTGQAEVIPDTRLDARYIVDDVPRLSEITVPISADGKVLGVIDAEHADVGFFTAEHLAILSAIAPICATKLVRARAEVRLRDINQELERRIASRTVELVQTNEQLKREITERRRTDQVQRALFEISEAVHSAGDLPSLYARIHEIIGTLMPAENFYLALHDEATDTVSFPYHRDRSDPPPPTRKFGRGMTEYVLRTGRAALADLNEIQRLKETGEYIQTGYSAAIWLGVPLTVEGKTFGVMAVQDAENATAFGPEEKRILSFVAGQTALAIDRKRSEERLRAHTHRLRESEERFSKAFAALPSNVSIVRARDQRFVEVNQALLDYSGFSRDEVINRTTHELGIWVNESHRDEFYRRLHTFGRVMPMEVVFRAKSGRQDTAILAAERIDVEGEPHILALSVIITERKKAEEELIRSLARERELSRLKSSFVSLVSHEFRTPIGIIHSSAEILERYFARMPETERQEHLRAIQSHAWRMAALMEEVLMFGRVEAGRLEFRPADFDLYEACRRWVEEMLLATDHRCPIHLTLGEFPAKVRGDVDLLRHIVSNLLSNAVKYSPPGRTVEFSVKRDGPQALFCVADRGMGIPAASRERLFTAFQRGENVQHLPGTGLGLVVIRHCLELHHGTIELDSTENLGTRVLVRVPLFESSS